MFQNRLWGKHWVSKRGEVSVRRTALQFVPFVKCHESEEVKEGAICVAPKAR